MRTGDSRATGKSFVCIRWRRQLRGFIYMVRQEKSCRRVVYAAKEAPAPARAVLRPNLATHALVRLLCARADDIPKISMLT
jgi:hypothetical protein